MPYSDEMIKVVCEDMGIAWDESGEIPTLNGQPLNVKELFCVDIAMGEELYTVIKLSVEEQTGRFDCSGQYLDAA